METGTLRNGGSFEARFLSMADLPEILKLQEKFYIALENKQVLQPLTSEEYSVILEDEEMMVGLFVNRQMIAFRAMVRADTDHEDLARDIGLSEAVFDRLVYSEITAVDPVYRGNGLQIYMGKFLFDSLDERSFRYVLSTVAPFNIPSPKDKFALDMKAVVLKEKYGRSLRYIFMRDLLREDVWAVAGVMIEMADTERQQQLLDDGYAGVDMKEKDGMFVMCVDSLRNTEKHLPIKKDKMK